MANGHPQVKGFFDHRTFSVQYVVSDPATKRCAIIDPVLDFDPKSGATATENADRLLEYVRQEGLEVEWILDTHPHADHFSANHYLQQKTGAPTAIGERVMEVQKLWKRKYDFDDTQLRVSDEYWDRLFADGDTFRVGEIDAQVMLSTGHTLASITYVIGDAAFVHDTLFMPDFGTARADFPGGDAGELWRSIQRILTLPDETRVFVGHDYMPGGREPAWESTIGEQKQHNPHLKDVSDEATFVRMRDERDAQLPMPALILFSLQINTRGGRLPEPHDNGLSYLRVPVNALDPKPWT